MLTLDGQNLLGDNEFIEAGDFINKYIPLESYLPWLQPTAPQSGLAMLTQVLGVYPYKKIKVGKFYWPTGMSRWAFGNFFVDSDTLGKIAADAYNGDGTYNQIPFMFGNQESNADSSGDGNTLVNGEVVTTNVYMLPPSPMSGIRGLSGQVRSLYLVTIVDSRYFYWYQNVGDIQVTSTMTWMSLYTTLFNILGVTSPTIDTIATQYLSPSIPVFSLPYEPVPPILDAVAWNLGHRIVANFDGSFSTQLYNTALMALNNDMMNNPNRSVIAGGQRFASQL